MRLENSYGPASARGIRHLSLQKSNDDSRFSGDLLIFGERLMMHFGRRRALKI